MAVQVEEVQQAKSGKSLRVKLGGTWYGAKLDSGLNGQLGKMIEAEIRTTDKYGPWIDKWLPSAAPQASPPSAGPSPSSQPAGAAPHERQYAEPAKPGVPLASAPWWMPFVSNCCAHAIQAGHCQTPAALKTWALGAKEAARALVSQTPATQDEDIPFN